MGFSRTALRLAFACLTLVPLKAMAGSEAIVHKFSFEGRGDRPFAGLLKVGSRFYGTAAGGGDSNNGVVFSVSPSGGYQIVHSFQGGSLGSLPASRLIEAGGVLYGTTLDGGSTGCAGAGCGTVFAVTPKGVFRTLYAFQGGADGSAPLTGLVSLDGLLYGTTFEGGGAGCGDNGCGTVFSITPEGAERVVYAFRGGTDGASPNDLIGKGTTLYATTGGGGGSGCGSGCGTVFAVTTAGAETVLHRFDATANGTNPQGRLLLLDGLLYGTTVRGGIVGPAQGALGYGTAFRLTTGGAYTRLHAFTGTDGRFVTAGLIPVGDLLYGTAQGGGANDDGSCLYPDLARRGIGRLRVRAQAGRVVAERIDIQRRHALRNLVVWRLQEPQSMRLWRWHGVLRHPVERPALDRGDARG